jgi:hypothetical protein
MLTGRQRAGRERQEKEQSRAEASGSGGRRSSSDISDDRSNSDSNHRSFGFSSDEWLAHTRSDRTRTRSSGLERERRMETRSSGRRGAQSRAFCSSVCLCGSCACLPALCERRCAALWLRRGNSSEGREKREGQAEGREEQRGREGACCRRCRCVGFPGSGCPVTAVPRCARAWLSARSNNG